MVIDDLFTIRALHADDIPAVAAIEAQSYAFPWREKLFYECLDAGYACFALVNRGHRVVGYSLFSMVLDEAHILNICIAPEYRRRGLAKQLLKRMERLAQKNGVRTMFLEVRPSNPAAHQLYQSLGYVYQAKRPNYYRTPDGQREDAWLYSHVLAPA